MSEDLVERLRGQGLSLDRVWALRNEAADEIDRLAEEVIMLEADIAGMHGQVER